MKVTFCAYDAPNYINGPNIWLRRLLPVLREQSVECRLLFMPAGDPGKCSTLQDLTAAGFDCSVFTRPNYTEDRLRWILGEVDRNPPDVFVPNLSIPAYFASRWIRKAGIPTVGVLHSDDPFYRAILEQFVHSPRHDTLSAVVGVSRLLESLCREKPTNGVGVHVIPYGVPVPSGTASRGDGPFSIVFVGRLVQRQKRILETVQALCRVTGEVPGTTAALYGSGPAEAEAMAIIERQGAGGRVRLGGLLDSGELGQRLLGAHAFVLLSDYEGLPIALMEAMACGVVPVCYDMRSGIPELLEDGVSGLVVGDRGDGFVAAVRSLVDDRDLWRRLSAGARNRVAEANSVVTSGRLWKEMFDQVHGSAPARRTAIEQPSALGLPPRHPDIPIAEDRRKARFFERCLCRCRRACRN